MSDDFLSSVDDVSGSVLPTFKPVAIQENTTLGYVNGHTLRTVFPGKTTYCLLSDTYWSMECFGHTGKLLITVCGGSGIT